MRPAMTRTEFLARKRQRLGRDGLEARYGCPYSILCDWTKYHVSWRSSIIIRARADPDDPYWAEYLTAIKAANKGISQMAKEYEKAIAPLGRATT